MTIQECRTILGDKGRLLTDNEVDEYIQQAGVLADALLDLASTSLLTHSKERIYDGN